MKKEEITFEAKNQIKKMAIFFKKMGQFFNQRSNQCNKYLDEQNNITNIQKQITKINKKQEPVIQNNKKIEKKTNQLKIQQDKKLENQNIQKNKLFKSFNKIKHLKPKHPVSSFFFFYKDKGQQIARQKGQIVGSKIAKIVAQMWKLLTQKQRQPYEQMARLTRQTYQKQMEQWKNIYGPQIQNFKRYKKIQGKIKKTKITGKQIQVSKPNKVQSKIQEQQASLNDDLSDSQPSLQDFNTQKIGESDIDILLSSSQKQNSKKKQLAIQMNSSVKQQNKNLSQPIKNIKNNNIKQMEQQTQTQNPTKQVNKDSGSKSKMSNSSFFEFYKQNGKQISLQENINDQSQLIAIVFEKWKKTKSDEKQKIELKEAKIKDTLNEMQIQQKKQILNQSQNIRA